MNRALSNLRLLGSAAGILRWLYPAVVLLAFGLTWLPLQRTALPSVLTAVTGAFAWMLIGSRLLALLHQGSCTRLPGLARQLTHLFALALACTVLLPALLYASRGADLGLSLSMLLLAATGGLLCSALPMWAITLLSFASGTLTGLLSHRIGTWLLVHPRTSMLIVAAIFVAITAWAYRATRLRGADQFSPWTRPTWMSLQQRGPGDGAVRQSIEAQSGRMAWLQGIARPVLPVDLRHDPERAMGYALGPGFAPGRLASTLLTSLAMPLLVLLCWTPVLAQKDALPELYLILANVIGCFSGIKYLQRLWLWRKQPNLGLLETALLPGLGAPGRSNQTFCRLVRKRAVAAQLPWLGLAWLVGALLHAPSAYFPLTILIQLTAAMGACTIILLCMRWPRGGLAMGAIQIALVVPISLSLAQVAGTAAAPPTWLMPAWSAALLCATGLFQFAARQLDRRPHPWLLN